MSMNRFTLIALVTILLGCSTGNPYVPSQVPRAGEAYEFSWDEREDDRDPAPPEA